MIPTSFLPTSVEPPTETISWTVGPESATCLGPSLTPLELASVASRLLHGAETLRERPTEEIVAAIDRVAERWLDRASPCRGEAEALLPRVTGYAPETIRHALDHLFAGFRAASLRSLLATEFADVGVLDGWIPGTAGGASVRAFGPRLTVVWASGNIPVAAIPAMFHALLLKSPCLVKTAAAEPLLPVLVARSLAAEASWLGDALAVLHWPGEDEALARAATNEAEAVIALGGDETLGSLRRQLPAAARLRAHGHRIGFGVIGREALTEATVADIAARVARDVALFDQQGCMSPQWFYVERSHAISPRQFADAIADELAAWETRAPRRPLTAADAARIHQLRATYEMRALADPELYLRSSPGGAAWTVLVDPRPEVVASPLNRTVCLHPIDDLAEVPSRIAPLAGHLQTVVYALAPTRVPDIADRLASLGVTRLVPLGQAQEPLPIAPHDGFPLLADLVRWVSLE